MISASRTQFCTSTMTNAIELHNVTKQFGSQTAVDSINLQVPEGSIYGFIGPNGSGKTTTLRMILRILQPDEGIVKVLGAEFGKTADNRLGYLPEERGLYKKMKVGNLLSYYASLKGMAHRESRRVRIRDPAARQSRASRAVHRSPDPACR